MRQVNNFVDWLEADQAGKKISIPSQWTEERVENLKTQWAEGHSAGTIGLNLGITRSAVLGKVHRLGLASRKTVTFKQTEKTAQLDWRGLPKRKSPKRKPPIDAAFLAQLEATITANPIKFNELKDGFTQCRYILGDVCGDDTLACGLPTEKTTGYCNFHFNLTHTNQPSPSVSPAEYELTRRRLRKARNAKAA